MGVVGKQSNPLKHDRDVLIPFSLLSHKRVIKCSWTTVCQKDFSVREQFLSLRPFGCDAWASQNVDRDENRHGNVGEFVLNPDIICEEVAHTLLK